MISHAAVFAGGMSEVDVWSSSELVGLFPGFVVLPGDSSKVLVFVLLQDIWLGWLGSILLVGYVSDCEKTDCYLGLEKPYCYYYCHYHSLYD